MMSPAGILAAGGATAAGIVVGLPLAAAVVVGAGAWAVRVGAAMTTGRPRGDRIDPFTLQEPWRRAVQDAVAARARFHEAVGRTRSGPLQDTLHGIAGQMDTLVQETWQIANRGESLVQTRRRIDTADIGRDLAEATQARDASPGADESIDRTIESLEVQQATAQRMDGVIEQARSQLRLLDARMGEAVVRALELSAQADSDASVSSLSTDVDSMVSDMEALRLALEETHGTHGTSTGGMSQGPAG